MAKARDPSPDGITEEQRREYARQRLSGPCIMPRENMTPEQIARLDAVSAAYRARDRGNFQPGIELGLFHPVTFEPLFGRPVRSTDPPDESV